MIASFCNGRYLIVGSPMLKSLRRLCGRFLPPGREERRRRRVRLQFELNFFHEEEEKKPKLWVAHNAESVNFFLKTVGTRLINGRLSKSLPELANSPSPPYRWLASTLPQRLHRQCFLHRLDANCGI